uniref:(northern house mosquito) hypothetical protein n=1 Tax=Culex pipiens TaxID=7175 RepID=A0A8D8CVB5_CULPI
MKDHRTNTHSRKCHTRQSRQSSSIKKLDERAAEKNTEKLSRSAGNRAKPSVEPCVYVSQTQVRGEQKRRVSVHSYTYINQRRCQLDDDVPAAAPPESVTKVVVVAGVIEVDDDVISLVRGPSDTRRTKRNNRKH